MMGPEENSPEVLRLLEEGQKLYGEKKFPEAERIFIRSVELQPQNPLTHYNLGVILAKLRRYEDAMACFKQAITIHPGMAHAYTNMGFCLNELNALKMAQASFHIAHQIDPSDPIPLLNEGLALLAQGQFKEGWHKFEARWQLPAYRKFRRHYSQPLWNGQNVKGKAILVYGEQGFGDMIQMARYVPLLEKNGAHVIVAVHPALVTLMQSVSSAATIISQYDEPPRFDFHCPMLSLPLGFGTTLETIPAHVPYLKADNKQVEAWISRIPADGKKRIGIVWAGRSTHERDHDRSLSFEEILPLIHMPNINWVSLQRIIPDQDKTFFAAAKSLVHIGEELNDFSATAEAIMNLDLVISVDTAVAHLAGALGKSVLILLPFHADWRWMQGREDSPWYPTAKLLRQEKRQDWTLVITRAVNQVQRLENAQA